MKEYKIGIIEDDLDQLHAIERTIHSNLFNKCNINFKDYDLSNKIIDYSNLSKNNNCKINIENIVNEIKEDITNNNIMLLLIDNKLIVKGSKLNGTSIYECVKKIISDFPIIILTNYGEDAYENDHVDPDKVYDKEKFLSNGDYTNDKIKSISLLMDNYIKLKNNILSEKERLINEYENSKADDSQEKLNELLKVENEMQKYTPVDITYLEKLISPDYVKEIIELLNEIREKIE